MTDPERPGLYTSVVPLYKYSDYADDYCAKNMSRVPLCTHLPWTEWAPSPPSPPRPKTPPTPRPYPIYEVKKEMNGEEEETNEDNEEEIDKMDTEQVDEENKTRLQDIGEEINSTIEILIKGEKTKIDDKENNLSIGDNNNVNDLRTNVNDSTLINNIKMENNFQDADCAMDMEFTDENLDDNVRLKAPSSVDNQSDSSKCDNDIVSDKVSVESEFKSEILEHRTVERTKDDIDGRTLYELCSNVRNAVPFEYSQVFSAPIVNLHSDEGVLNEAFAVSEESTERDELGRPVRPGNFAEWHECAKLGDLIALPYVVID